MAFGAIKIFGPTLRRRLLSNMGEGAPPTAEYFDYTLGNSLVLDNRVVFWNPALSAFYHKAETSGVATDVSICLYVIEDNSAGAQIRLVGDLIRRTAFTTGTTIETFDPPRNTEVFSGNITKGYMVNNRLANGATDEPRRFARFTSSIGQHKRISLLHTSSFNFSTGSTNDTNFPSAKMYGAANTGGDFGDQGGATTFQHEWFRSTDLDSAGLPYLEINVHSAARGTDGGGSFSLVRTIQLVGVDYKILDNAIHGLGVPTNSDGVSFMHTVNLSTGKDELLVCNGHTIVKFDGFGYNTIDTNSDNNVLQSAAVNINTNKQGMISYFDATEKFMDVLMFNVTCASTSSIEIDMGELFTIDLSNQSKPRLGQGNKNGRLMLSTTDNGTNTYVRTLQSNSINNLRMCNGVSDTDTAVISDHTCLNRFVDTAGLDNFLFLMTYSTNANTLNVRGIIRSTAASVAYVNAGYVFADSSTDYVEDTI
jgi:hypothetical protein